MGKSGINQRKKTKYILFFLMICSYLPYILSLIKDNFDKNMSMQTTGLGFLVLSIINVYNNISKKDYINILLF